MRAHQPLVVALLLLLVRFHEAAAFVPVQDGASATRRPVGLLSRPRTSYYVASKSPPPTRTRCRRQAALYNADDTDTTDTDTTTIITTNKDKKARLPPALVTKIDSLVSNRAEARLNGDYTRADALRHEIEKYDGDFGDALLPAGYCVTLTDIPRKLGGGSTWDVVPQVKEPIERVPPRNGDGDGHDDDGQSVLQLSHAALGLATLAAENDVPLDPRELDAIVRRARARLELTGPTELRGRKAADAAFWFALSGISDANASRLLESLTVIAIEELQRFGTKPSCRAKDVLHIVERLFAAGITGEVAQRLSHVAAQCLEVKEFKGRNTSTNQDILDLLRNNAFDLHSDRPLLWIWRFSIRQRKQRSFLRGAAKKYERFRATTSGHTDNSVDEQPQQEDATTLPARNGDSAHIDDDDEGYKWEDLFDDPSLPLVVDVGCGMGVSLHGLATLSDEEDVQGGEGGSSEINLVWSDCNYVGVDLSRLAVGYANAIASRWDMTGRLRYLVDSAEHFLDRAAETYPGTIRLVMIQFPTPFRLQQQTSSSSSVPRASSSDDDDDTTLPAVEGGESPAQSEKKTTGNQQLPKHPHAGFMVTANLLNVAREALLAPPDSDAAASSGGGGRLLLQSNCEDVAVYMRGLATEGEEAGFNVVPVSNPLLQSFEEESESANNAARRVPQRTLEYINAGGERALGSGWSASALLPRRGSTETEVACFLETTPVHRCVLVPSAKVEGGEDEEPLA